MSSSRLDGPSCISGAIHTTVASTSAGWTSARPGEQGGARSGAREVRPRGPGARRGVSAGARPARRLHVPPGRVPDSRPLAVLRDSGDVHLARDVQCAGACSLHSPGCGTAGTRRLALRGRLAVTPAPSAAPSARLFARHRRHGPARRRVTHADVRRARSCTAWCKSISRRCSRRAGRKVVLAFRASWRRNCADFSGAACWPWASAVSCALTAGTKTSSPSVARVARSARAVRHGA